MKCHVPNTNRGYYMAKCQLDLGHEGRHSYTGPLRFRRGPDDNPPVETVTWENEPETECGRKFGSEMIAAFNGAFLGCLLLDNERNRRVMSRLFDNLAEDNEYGYCPDCEDRIRDR